MARTFTTRVVLHNASWADYQVLYAEMAKRRFTDEIRADDGSVYKMPDGEYTSYGDITIEDVRSLAVAAAAVTGRGHAVFVTEAARTCWYGLPIVKAAPRRA